MELPNDLKHYERPGFYICTQEEAGLGLLIFLGGVVILDRLGVWQWLGVL